MNEQRQNETRNFIPKSNSLDRLKTPAWEASWIVDPFMNLESRQCSKPVETRPPPPPPPPFVIIYSFRGLDGFERLSAEATFRAPPHTAKLLASARRVSGV